MTTIIVIIVVSILAFLFTYGGEILYALRESKEEKARIEKSNREFNERLKETPEYRDKQTIIKIRATDQQNQTIKHDYSRFGPKTI